MAGKMDLVEAFVVRAGFRRRSNPGLQGGPISGGRA